MNEEVKIDESASACGMILLTDKTAASVVDLML
jgi:hypothetical protein